MVLLNWGETREEVKEMTRPFDIPKKMVFTAYELVKANAGAAGVDQQSLEDFERNLKRNLYKIWNRMSSGSYFPPPVRQVPIPKKAGGIRILGIPTVGDRIAQAVVKLWLEPYLEPCFLPDSYGYRPNKSALDAVGVVRKRCWSYDWVLEFDIKGLFDNIPHELLMKAVRKHTNCGWVLLYIERWIKAPMEQEDGTQITRDRGTPQGGVISPLLSNLFMHYAFDLWMKRNHSDRPWCRYADDGLVHLESEHDAWEMYAELKQRFAACGLELHPEKTKIVYCKDDARKGNYQNTSFDFLGYTFRPRSCKSPKGNSLFVGFTPAVSGKAMKGMRSRVRKLNVRNRTDLTLEAIAKWLNPILRGWLNYYGVYRRSCLNPLWRHIDRTLMAWLMATFGHLRNRKTKAATLLLRIARKKPNLFVHWQTGMVGSVT